MSEPEVVAVPRELYYHEVEYVRGLEARVKELEALIEVAGRVIDRIPGAWEYWEPNDQYVERLKVLRALTAAKEGRK